VPQGGAASCVAIYAGCPFNVNQGSLSFFISSSQAGHEVIFYQDHNQLDCDELTAAVAGAGRWAVPGL
jgi:hypothetical protein